MTRLLPLLLAIVSILPGARAALPGLTYYFRDFTLTYYPLRAFFAAEISEGRWPFWNPYVHEGAPFLPMLYPLELVQVLAPGPAFVSWLLTLHFPIAAFAMYALADELGATRRGAFVAGAAYAMGGLALSCLPLHWFLQALALAPLVALTQRRAAAHGGRALVTAALVLALAISTLAVEFVAQGLLLGIALALATRFDRQAGLRLAGATALGVALASLPIFLMAGIVGESLRGAGLGTPQLLERSLPPVALLQALVPDLVGSIREPQRFWWGGRLFPGGPYFMSLYLGPVVLALAAWGLGAIPKRLRWTLALLAAVGIWYALGAAAGLAPIVAPLLRVFRFPVKALLLPYLVVALACGFGVDRLAAGRGLRGLALWGGALGLLGALVAVVGASNSEALAAWLDISPASQAVMRATLLREGLQASTLSLALIVLAVAALRRLLLAPRAAALAAVLVIADLSRAGSGMNPQAPSAFFEPLPAVREALAGLDGGRVFSYGIDRSPALAAWSAGRPSGVERVSFYLSRQLMSPFSNVQDRVETAEGHDRLSFVPNRPRLRTGEYDPALVQRIVPRLREAAVTRLVSLDALDAPELRLRAQVPVAPAGLSIHVYDLADPSPRASVACSAAEVALEARVTVACGRAHVVSAVRVPGREDYVVETDGPGLLLMRDNYTPHWRATLDGAPVPLLRANGRHRAVAVAAGSHSIGLRYDPPGLRVGLAGSVLAALLAAALWRRGSGRPA